MGKFFDKVSKEYNTALTINTIKQQQLWSRLKAKILKRAKEGYNYFSFDTSLWSYCFSDINVQLVENWQYIKERLEEEGFLIQTKKFSSKIFIYWN